MSVRLSQLAAGIKVAWCPACRRFVLTVGERQAEVLEGHMQRRGVPCELGGADWSEAVRVLRQGVPWSVAS